MNFNSYLCKVNPSGEEMSIQRAYHWCKRYLSFTLLGAIAVAGYVLFYNDNSLLHTYDQEREIEEIKQQIAQAQDTLEYYRQLNASLNTDPQTLERVVREQYHMQRPDEDVYLFE